MWSDVPLPWQACLELAWEAYLEDCIPIGAVVTDASGNILTRGRNRIYEKVKRDGHSIGATLNHAEVEALRALDLDAVDPHTCVLYTTTEPCPMCLGTFYMSGVRTLHYAARDPYAGSVNLLGTTWYLGHKPIRVFGPDRLLELVVTGLFIEQDYFIHGGTLPEGNFYRRYWEVYPSVVEFGVALARSGAVRDLRKRGASAEEMLETLASQVK